MQALLALADGTVYRGEGFGAATSAVGEVVFNTAMTGYQEIVTDPSYARQLVTLTYPHIGNTGCNAVDAEAPQPMAAGLIIRDLSPMTSSWRSEISLSDYLEQAGLPGIAGIDTRHLTRLIRSGGAQAGCLVTGENPDESEALAQARAFPGLKGMDLARAVSCRESFEWHRGSLDLDRNVVPELNPDEADFHVVAYDFGCKRNILRLLVDRGCRVTVVPAQTAAADVMALEPDGVFLSNGPGDPQPCDYAIAATREFVEKGIPLFGICLGHQLLGLAAGGRTTKMKFGHHGANHPVQDLATGQVLISSQNHGFAVDEASLPDSVETTHRSLFDGTLQGIRIKGKPAFSFQGHPEASPGPHDVRHLFDRFIELMGQQESIT